MLRSLVHRGPDDAGEVQVDGAWLGHRRLSIVDVDGGHQPFSNAAGDVWLVGNGEVYNHAEVRATLADAPFATRSDNEVALHLLDERGPAALDELEGMFAFLVAGEDGRFIAARDAVGIKPLYWARARATGACASRRRSRRSRRTGCRTSRPSRPAATGRPTAASSASPAPCRRTARARRPRAPCGPPRPSRPRRRWRETREILVGAVDAR